MRFSPILILIISISFFSCKNEKSDTPPNIIAIVIDDAGYVDFGFMGSKDLETPNIDALAQSGVMFTDAHVSATVCSPSRAGIMTGIYQQKFGFENNGTGNGQGLDPSVKTIANALKSQGYTTLAMGKWHLGEKPEYHPNNRGFDEFYGFLAGGRSYFPLQNPSEHQMLQHNGQKVNFEGYMTDVLGEQAVSFIEKYKHKPFFMYFAPNAVHTPMEAKEEDLKKYNGHPRKELSAMTWSLDENIGKIIQKLKAENIYDNTLIFFVSDNGGAHNNQSSTGPLKGWKGNKFEGGHRVPFIVSWPSKLKGGQKFDGLTSSLDIFATTVEVAGVSQKFNAPLDGVNLMPYLNGEATGEPHQELFWRKDEMAAARVGDHKVIRLERFGSTLYNLKDDLGEQNDLKMKKEAVSAALNAKLENWEKGLITPLWYEEKEWTDVTYHIHKTLMENKKVMYKSPSEHKAYLNTLAGE